GDLVEVLPVHGVETGLYLSCFLTEQVLFQILPVRVVNVRPEKAGLHLFDGIPVFEHSAFELGKRILPRDVTGNDTTDTVDKGIGELVPQRTMLMQRLDRVL